MNEKIIFSGFGGQGVMFIGQLLAYTAMDEGLDVTWIPSYGPEMRGGTAHCYVVISDKPIGSPVFKNPDVAVVFNIPSHNKYEPLIRKDGILVTNSSLVQDSSERLDITEIRIPATDLASDSLENTRLTNIILLGALLAHEPFISLDAIRKGLEIHIPEHRKSLLPLNFEALDIGASFVYDRQKVR